MTHNFVETNAMIEGRERGTEEQSPGSSVANPRGREPPLWRAAHRPRLLAFCPGLTWPGEHETPGLSLPK